MDLLPASKGARNNARQDDTLDFGWTRTWTRLPLLTAVAGLCVAAGVSVGTPWWPVPIVATLLAANAFAGFLLARAAHGSADATLPWVPLLDHPDGLVLDGGCGAGRTTIGLARALPAARIVALDRFDAGYIAGGGRDLLTRNLALSGLSGRVQIEAGDLTAMPFGDAQFDAAVSAHALDHLGPAKLRGLQEMARVLKPGGRLLLIVWVPGWAMFAVANVLSLALTRRSRWRALAGQAGFALIDEGRLHGHAFFLLGKRTDAAH
jgi:SAM-dependent methyltransferase